MSQARGGPSTGALLVDNLVRRFRSLIRALARLVHPLRSLGALRRGWPAVREAFFEERAPETTLNTHGIGWHRRVSMIGSDLALFKAIARDHGGTVNDVLLAVVAGGLREILLSRHERVDQVVLGPRYRWR